GWNSAYYMLIKFIHLQPALQMLQADNSSDAIVLLEPIEHATKLLSASSYSTHDLETHYNDDEFTQPMIANSIHHKLEEYWPFLDITSQISSILDPRCKLSAFKDDEKEN
ncbi:11760_t:CDS:2, partial [Entrophospora sp. SA101]